MKKLGLFDCVEMGEIRLLSGSEISSTGTLILENLRLDDTDIDAIGGFDMHELFFYRTPRDAHNNNLAKILERELVADYLTSLHIIFVDYTDISIRETNAISSLRGVRALSLKAELRECKVCISRILDGTPISAGLKELTLDLPAILPSDLDVVAGMNIDFLSVSCRNFTSEHLSRIGARTADSPITRLEIKGADANDVFEGLTAFRNLRSLKLERYTASAWPWPDLTTNTRRAWAAQETRARQQAAAALAQDGRL